MLSTVLPLHQKCITIATLLYIVDGIKLYGTYNEQLCHASQSIGWFWRLKRLQMHCLLNDGWILCKLKCKCISMHLFEHPPSFGDWTQSVQIFCSIEIFHSSNSNRHEMNVQTSWLSANVRRNIGINAFCLYFHLFTGLFSAQ